MRHYELVVLLGCTLLLSHCGSESSSRGKKPPKPSSTPAGEDEGKADSKWDNIGWIDKAARMLRNGKGISADDDVNQLLAMSRKDVVRKFMKSREFIDTTYHFNLYFLGFYQTPDDFSSVTGVDAEAAWYPSAITSALAVRDGVDYFSLLDYDQAIPLEQSFLSTDEVDGIKAAFNEQLASTEAKYASLPREEFCREYDSSVFDDAVFSVPRTLRRTLEDGEHLGKLNLYCAEEVDSLEGLFAHVAQKFEKFLTLAASVSYDHYEPQHVDEIKRINPSDYGLDYVTPLTQRGFWFDNPNSSTNFNRSRAAYVLQRLFCDDLTPINVETPDDHAGDRHASDPACQSCHYKLDPMAGFFKDHGVVGTDFSNSETIVLDDGVQVALEDYRSNWRSADSAWTIGYIRSTSDPSLNSSGTNLRDLFRIAKKAPEVKACLTQRMFEFYVANDQAVDKGFLAELTKEFENAPAGQSSKAYRNIVQRLVLSDTFARKDPISTACYDYAEGIDPMGRPPCDIAFVLDQNCASCHGANAPAGGLNLTSWVETSAGELSFQHSDSNGQQKQRSETMEAILKALESTDPAVRMPMNQHMSAQDREMLYLWVNETLTSGGSR